MSPAEDRQAVSPLGDHYLVVPMQPTPNGRMHLGHLAGPYLRADAFARHVRSHGGSATVVSGSDSFESWVGVEQGMPVDPHEAAAHNHAAIEQDLRSVGVDVDCYVDPLSDEHADLYRRSHEEIIGLAQLAEAVEERQERTPVADGTDRVLTGVWIRGRCPRCDDGVVGNACESCGTHFQPNEIVDARPLLDSDTLSWQDRTSQYLRPPLERLREAIAGLQISERFRQAALTYVDETEGRVRLTIPSAWGLTGSSLPPGVKLCNTYYAYSVYCGRVYARLTGRPNPFEDPDTGTRTVALFGFDNAVAGIVGPTAHDVAVPELRVFDHLLGNHFLSFEGSKFSTSRQWGIWVHDLLDQLPTAVDAVRLALAQIAPEENEENLTIDGLADMVDRVSALATRGVRAAHERSLSAHPEGTTADWAIGADLLAEQADHMAPDRVSLRQSAHLLLRWLEASDEQVRPADAYWWLRTLALLAWPLMPDLASRAWTATGGQDEPRVARFREVGVPVEVDWPAPVAQEDIRSAIRRVARFGIDTAETARATKIGAVR